MYNNSNYNKGGNNNYPRQQNNQNAPQYKKSGATYTKIKEGMKAGFFHVSAWRATKQGLMTASCFPQLEYSSDKPTGVKTFTGEQNGNSFIKYVVTISMNGMTQKYYALMPLQSRKIYIKELNLIISPNGQGMTKSGKKVRGYFGKTQ